MPREVTLSFSFKNTFLFLATLLLFAPPSSLRLAQARNHRNTSSASTVSQANKSSLLEQESLVSHLEPGKYSQVRMKAEVKVLSHDFFRRYAQDFKLSKDDEFKPVFSRPNPLHRAKAQIVIGYQQHYKNLPVIGTGYVLQTDLANHVLAASGKVISGLNVNTNPSVSESRALEVAKHAVPAQIYSWEKDATKFPKGTLAISFKDFKIGLKNARLVYRFTISSEKPSQSYIVEVDAHTGEVLNKINNRISDVVNWNQNIPNCQLAGYGTRTVTVVCDKGADGKFRLMCLPGTMDSCAAPMKMIDARRPNPQAQGGADPNQDYVFADEDHQDPPIFGEKNVAGEFDDIVGGYLYVSMLFSMKLYSQYFGWAGYDGLGQISMLNYVRKIDDPNTAAFYDRPSHSITFDPDKTVMVDSNGNVDMFYGIVTGHEFTHGVLRELIPGLVAAGETASLDESFADIMGTLAVYYGAYYPVSIDFKSCLEGIGHPGIMDDPESSDLPSTYKGFFFAGTEDCNASATCYHTPETTVPCVSSNYDCDPDHRNAKVQSYMFYLLASGGSGVNDPPLNHPYNVEGIGPYEAAQIAFQTMLARLSPTSTYPEARDEWIDAAKDLYGTNSREVRAVTLAWYAVGIGDISGMDVSHNPADGDKNVSPWPATLEWEGQANEVTWEVQTSTSPDFDRDLLTKQTSVATRPPNGSAASSVNFNLKPDTNYYWRVRGKRNPSSSGKSGSGSKFGTPPPIGLQTDWGDWSLLRYFKTDTRASKLKSPVGREVYPWGTEFKWTAVEGGKDYWLQTSENKDLGIGSNLGPGSGTGNVISGNPIQNVQPNNPLESISLSGVHVDPNDPDNKDGGNRIKHALPFALKVDHTYCWGVLPYGPENIQGNWSNHQIGECFQTSTPQTKLTSPENFAKVSPWGIKLQWGPWGPTPGAVGYILKISKHPDFPDNLYTGPDPTGTSQVINLPIDTQVSGQVSQNPQSSVSENPSSPGISYFKYYWTVTPKGPPPYNEKGLASEIWGFNIDPQATKPVLHYPPDGGHVPYKQALRFLWKPVDYATGYFFTLYKRNADGSRGAAVISNWSIPPREDDRGYVYVDHVDLRNEGVTEKAGYCWQVQAIGPDFNQGPPSDTFCYGLGPDKPIITSPLDGASGVEYNPTTFTWNSEWAPGGYMICVGVVGGPSCSYVNVSGKSYTLNLKPSTNYFWSVTAKGSSSGESTSSGISHFSTKAAHCNAPDLPQILDPPGNPDGQIIRNPYQYRWSSVPGAAQYEFTVYWVPDYYNPTDKRVVYHNYYNGTVSDSVPITCGNQNIYIWSVRAKSSCGAWSAANWSQYFTCH